MAADSLMVTAADVSGTSEALERGLEMAPTERRARGRRLRATIREEDLEWWLSRQLRDLAAVAAGRRPPSRALRNTVRRFNPELRG
jgi:trehalose-6-phosphate synthase